MYKHSARVLTAILFAGLFVSALADKLARPAPQKYCGRTVPPQESSHPYHPSLDDVYYSTDVPRDIPDGDTAVSVLTIPDNVLITDLNVMVTITHPWIRDLRISLIAPNDSEVVLLDLFPGDSIQNMTDTWFDDEAAVRIDSGAPPFTGRFRPLDSLSAFDGLSTQGTWTLRVVDQFHLDTGRVEAWAIEINRAHVLTGAITDQTTLQPVPQVRVEVLPNGNTALSDVNGAYGFDALDPGTYSVRFSKTYYDTLLVPNVVIVEGQVTVLDTSMHSAIQFYNFPSTSPPVPIPDGDPSGVQMTLDVTENVLISDLDVTVNVTHDWIGDLDLILFAPSGDSVSLALVGANCIFMDTNIVDCRFDDEASQDFASGLGPFTGSYRPLDTLSSLDNTSSQGTWRLKVNDWCAGDAGIINNFTLHVQSGSLPAIEPRATLPLRFTFHGNYPNPFNATTEFRFTLTRQSDVELVLYDVTGRRTATILNRMESAGEHSVRFDATNLPSGIYIARLSALGQFQSHKIVLLK